MEEVKHDSSSQQEWLEVPALHATCALCRRVAVSVYLVQVSAYKLMRTRGVH